MQASKGESASRFLFYFLLVNLTAIFSSYRPAENVPPPEMPRDASPGTNSQDDDRPLTDEELAWRLMQEEEQEFQRRMLALAGVQYPGADLEGADLAQGVDSEDDVPDTDAMSYEELTALGEVVGTVATGLSQAQIDALPVMKYAQLPSVVLKERNAEDNEEEQCAVCRLEFEAEDDVKQLPCGHYYHPECVGQWLQQKKVCPQCNREIEPEKEESANPPPAVVAEATALV